MFDKSVFTVNESNLTMRINQAAFYLGEYEKEVARAQGAANVTFRSKEDALGRIRVLNDYAPDDPRIQDLFMRAKACVKGGAGKIDEVDKKLLVYLENEENMRKHFAKVSEEAWNRLVSEYAENTLERMFPTPDMKQFGPEEMKGKIVVLNEVRYPENQFMGINGEYIWTGTRSDGMYFIKIDGREWLGPYEAVKRYRRQVDTTLMEVKEWSLIGQITDLAMDIPDANENKVTGLVMAWEVTPIALYVPGHILAVIDTQGEHTGRFVDEEKVEAMKEACYTVKEVPSDVTPERLVEIFMAAIKEKNYALYLDCIDPERRETAVQRDLLNYHWDLHQERFHREYIHANVNPDETKITVTKGYDETGDDAYFLDDDEIAKLKEAYGETEEEAVVQTAAIDSKGKQLGTPANHVLRRVGNGRWYISTYEVRF